MHAGIHAWRLTYLTELLPLQQQLLNTALKIFQQCFIHSRGFRADDCPQDWPACNLWSVLVVPACDKVTSIEQWTALFSAFGDLVCSSVALDDHLQQCHCI
jgi:hypothetical protein